MDLGKILFSKKGNKQKASSDISNTQPTCNRFELAINADHPLLRLYSLTKQSSGHLKLYLLSDDKDCALLTDEIAASETEKIQKSLALAANRRLLQVLPQDSKTVQNLDESAFVYVSMDKMLAWILLFPATGDGRALTGSQLLQALIDRGVTYGIDYEKLYAIPSLPDRCFQLHLIACGRPSTNGKDGSIIELYPRYEDIKLALNGLSHVDYAKINLGRKVQKGGVICEIIPPTPGISGIAVTRDLLLPPPKDGQAAYIPKGRNTALSKDGRYLIAEKTGHISSSGSNIQVKAVLEIPNGIQHAEDQDINFLGDVHIHGDVCAGVMIRAMGDVQIDGVAESCTIEAGENIVVIGGIQGHHASIIHAHKSIYAKYLENCDVYAQENILADCIIDCNIYCNGTITAHTGMGAILRGTVRSAKGIYANIIGSQAEVKTEIILGGLPCAEAEKEVIAQELDQINAQIERLSKAPQSTENQSKLAKLRLNQCVAKMKLDKFEKDFEKYTQNDMDQDLCKLVFQTVYPGTNVTIGSATFPVETVHSDCTIGMVEKGAVGYIYYDEEACL